MYPRNDIPERDRLCIFAANAFASAAVVVFGAAILVFCFDVVGCAEEDMSIYAQSRTASSNNKVTNVAGNVTGSGKDGIGEGPGSLDER